MERPEGTRREAIGLILYLVAFFVVWGIRATVLFPIDKAIHSDVQRQAYAQTIRILIWVLPVFGYLRFIDHVDPLNDLKLNTTIGRGQLVPNIALVVTYLALGMLFNALISGRKAAVDYPSSPAQWLKLLVFVPIAPIAEEIVFRGFILRKLGRLYPFWTANLITSLLFTAIHWPNWVFVNGVHPKLILMSATICVFGYFLGYLVKTTDSLWPAILTHTVNNLLFAVVRFG
jgi:uncharacterized protein